MKQIFAVLTLALGLSSVSQAGILVEPYLGYETGDFTATTAVTNTDMKSSESGVEYGLRLGYKFLIPWIALDYTAGSGKDKSTTAGVADVDYNRSSLGAVVGADLPLVRFWAGYGLSNDLIYKSATSSPDTKFKGSYLKVGAGLKVIPLMSVNLEYKINTYNKIDAGTEVDMSSVFSSHKNDMLMISISAPFNL